MTKPGTHPVPMPPSMGTQRIMKRRALKNLAIEDLFEIGLPAESLKSSLDVSPLLAIGIEESIARIVSANIPKAHTIVLVEDISHDSPHGHIEKILDMDRQEIANGLSDEWHELIWTHEVDEFAWDFHYYAHDLFQSKEGAEKKQFVIPVRAI